MAHTETHCYNRKCNNYKHKTNPSSLAQPREICNQAETHGTHADKEEVIEEFKYHKCTAFALSISANLQNNRNMTAGVAIKFRKRFGRP